MPSDIFEEPLELEIGLLEAGHPTAASYPYPSLAATGASTKATRRIVREIHRHAGHIEPMIAFPTSVRPCEAIAGNESPSTRRASTTGLGVLRDQGECDLAEEEMSRHALRAV